MKRHVLMIGLAILGIAISCSPFPARIRTDHAREFGREQRWVQVREESPGHYRATGCGFLSEWECQERACRMRDHRAFGVSGP